MPVHPLGTRYDDTPGSIYRPENYGAVGDGTTDDTTAFQSCIDAVIDAGGGTILLEAKTYLLDGTPRTDRSGHCIVSILDALGSQVPIVIKGAKPVQHSNLAYVNEALSTHAATVLKTTKTTAYSATYGPPSVIGGGTAEQSALTGTYSGTANFTAHIGPVYLQNLAIQVPLNPSVCGVDGLTFGGLEMKDCAVVAGEGGDASGVPTNTAFGVRWPARWGGPMNRNLRTTAFQFYCGHAFYHDDHHQVQQGGAHRCIIAYGFEGEGGDALYPVNFTYGQIQACNYWFSGYDVSTGVEALGRDAYLFGVVQTEAGSSPWNVTQTVNDASNNFNGNLQTHYFNSINVSGTPSSQSGANLLPLRQANQAMGSVASAAGAITLPTAYDFINVTGTAAITDITASWAGRIVTLRFASTASLADGGNLKLSAAMSGTADDTITLGCNGTNWYEIARSVN